MDQEVCAGDRNFINSFISSKKDEILYSGMIQKEEKKKMEQRILVVSTRRLYLFKPSENKVYKEAHILELTEVRSHAPNEITLICGKIFDIEGTTTNADGILTAINDAFDLSFFGIPDDARCKMDVKPPSRIAAHSAKELPLGGFINTYTALCDLFGIPRKEEICWDMENTYTTKNIKTFDMNEFEQPLQPADHRALLGALKYNRHFTSLVVSDISFTKDMIGYLADTLKTNYSIECLKLASIGAKGDAMTAISASLAANKNIALTEIDLSNNPLEDKGIQAFANYIQSTPRGLVKLDVSNCGLSKTGTTSLANGLKKNVKMSATLSYLYLSGNKLDAEGSSALASFLASPNALQTLVLGSTMPTLETIIGAMVRGCNELKSIDLSDNRISKKDVTLLVRFISASPSLKNINMSRTMIPADALKEFVGAITGNVYLSEVTLHLKGNDLGLAGAKVIASFADKLTNITHLDLDDNDFSDEGVATIADGMRANSCIKKLNLSRNFKPSRAKTRTAMLDSLTDLLSSECPVESLVIQGGPKSQLRADLTGFIYDLATNDSLLDLDVSGHAMGNKGAIALGKSLQTNTTLTSLFWDDNTSTLPGLSAFRTGLERNHTLKVMPIPLIDVAAAFKETAHQPKLQQIISEIEVLINRNQTPKGLFEANKSSTVTNFAVLSSGLQQSVDKLLLKIKSIGKKVEDKEGQKALHDAGSTEKLVATMHLLRETIHQATEIEMNEKLKAFSVEAAAVIRQKRGELTVQLMKLTEESFTSLDQTTLRRLRTGIEFGTKEMDEAQLEKILVKATGQEMSVKANEVYLSSVDIAADYIYEKIEEKLEEVLYALTSPEKAVKPAASPAPAAAAAAASPASPAPLAKQPPAKPAPRVAPSGPSSTNLSGSGSAAAPASPTTAGDAKEQPKQKFIGGKVAANSAVASAIGRTIGSGLKPPPRTAAPKPDEAEASATSSPSQEAPKKPAAPRPTPPKKPAATPATTTTSSSSSSSSSSSLADLPASEEPELVHMTKDRPKMAKGRKPPSRRPRPSAE